jgi:hypothetical protein
MRNILFFALAILTFVACNKEITDPQAHHSEQGGWITIRASIGNSQTKTTVEYGNTDYTAGEISEWVQGDQIRVFFYDIDGAQRGNVVFKAKTSGTYVEFEIDETERDTIPAVGITYAVKAVYPKDATGGISFDSQAQTGADAGHIGGYDVMTADSSVPVAAGDITFDLAFTHRLPILRFSLLNDMTEDITIKKISIRSGDATNTFYDYCSYDINNNILIPSIPAESVSLTINSSPTIAKDGIFDAYMIIADNVVSDNTDNVMINVIFNNGTSNGTQEFTIPRVGNGFLEDSFEEGKRYYFKLKLTGANIEENIDIGDARYRFNTTEKTASVISPADTATSIVIPATVLYNGKNYDVTSIGSSAFANTNLTKLTFASGSLLTTIGIGAFTDCHSLSDTLHIPASVISIGNSAFANTRLKRITFPYGSRLTTIGEYAFGASSVTTINMNCTTPPTLDSYALSGLSDLTIYVPQSAAGAYNAVISNKSNGWVHNNLGPVSLAAGSSVTLYGLSGTDGNVTISATL